MNFIGKDGVCVQKSVDLKLLEAKVCVCAQISVDLIILEARVGVCVQKPVDFVKLELSSYILIWSRHFLVDLMI